MGEVFEINMLEDVNHFSPGPQQTLSVPSAVSWFLKNHEIVNKADKTTISSWS